MQLDVMLVATKAELMVDVREEASGFPVHDATFAVSIGDAVTTFDEARGVLKVAVPSGRVDAVLDCEAPGCAAAYLSRWLAPRRAKLELERGPFSASYDRVPDPLPAPAPAIGTNARRSRDTRIVQTSTLLQCCLSISPGDSPFARKDTPFARKDTFLYCRVQKWVEGGGHRVAVTQKASCT